MESKKTAVLVGVNIQNDPLNDSSYESLEELERLADTADIQSIAHVLQNRHSIEAPTYIGEGKLNEIKEIIDAQNVDMAIFDHELSGSQIRNIEEILGVDVMDRSTLILDIFAGRALTREGKIQVELAQLKYILPRLTGMGKQLSRIGGGSSTATRGAGETKTESDRRHIRKRINYLESELKEISKNRETQRGKRQKDGIPQIGIIGYTNAGKSSLLNYLTDAGVLVENKLFATLDPTARNLKLEGGQEVVLIDTVGFIKKLPHHLVEAFKSTLEETRTSDLLLLLCDSSDPHLNTQLKVIEGLLNDLGIGEKPIITAYNKIDIKSDVILPRRKPSVEISVKTGEGIELLLKTILDVLEEGRQRIVVEIPFDRGDIVSLIHSRTRVIKEEHAESGTIIECIAEAVEYNKIKQYEKM